MNKHDEYIERCKKQNLSILSDLNYKVVVRHKRKNGQKVGTVVVYKSGYDKSIWFGVSKCKKGDKFEKHLGIKLAIERAVPVSVRTIKSNKLTKALQAATPLSMVGFVEDVIYTISRRKAFIG